METQHTDRLLIVDNEDVAYVREAAAAHDVTVELVDHRGIEPVLTTTLIIFGASAAVGLVTTLVDRHRGGQVIDLRPGTPKALYRTKDVLYGLVVIYTSDGRVTVEVKEPAGMFGQVLESLTGLIGTLTGADATDVATAVTARVGDAATITTDSTDLL